MLRRFSKLQNQFSLDSTELNQYSHVSYQMFSVHIWHNLILTLTNTENTNNFRASPSAPASLSTYLDNTVGLEGEAAWRESCGQQGLRCAGPRKTWWKRCLAQFPDQDIPLLHSSGPLGIGFLDVPVSKREGLHFLNQMEDPVAPKSF